MDKDLINHELSVTRHKIQDLEKNLEDVQKRKNEFEPKIYTTITTQYSQNLEELRKNEADYLEKLEN